MSNNKQSVKKAQPKNVVGGSDQVEYCTKQFSYYLYKEVNKLWNEIMHLQVENNKLRSQIKGA